MLFIYFFTLDNIDNADFIDSVIQDGFEFQFPAGEATNEVVVPFPIVDDDVNEADERFLIVLEISPKEELKAKLVVFERPSAVCTILDNDG